MRLAFAGCEPLLHKLTSVTVPLSELIRKLRSFRQDLVIRWFVRWRRDTNNRSPDGTVIIERLFVEVIEEGADGIEIFLLIAFSMAGK